MSAFVKICGLRDPGMVDVALAAGADAIGLVFARSVRAISVPDALPLADHIRSNAELVAVMRHPAPQFAKEVLDRVRPDRLQTDAGDYAGLSIPDYVRQLPVYRDTAQFSIEDLPETVLFEGGDSGTGRTADWVRAEEIARARQLFLAGGLSPDNVHDAILTVRPAGVDVSSGVEARRGEKDAGAIRAFVEAAKAAFDVINEKRAK
ncbi:MAG: phosphoribosylanthranilate isomerase [Pseudomonadota bacterium]